MSIDKEQVKQALQETFIIDEVVEQMAKEDGFTPDMTMIKSNRGRMWSIFADEVANHIENYTVKQYGDYPDDQVAKWDEGALKLQIEKYLNRLDTNQRGDMEANMDLIKIAHYAQLIWSKRLGFEDTLAEIIAERNSEHTEEVKHVEG